MSDGWFGIFSGKFSMERVNPIGLVLMIVAVVLAAVAERISKRYPQEKQLQIKNILRLVASLICCVGALIAILG